MPAVLLKRIGIRNHARYLIWATRVVAAVNRHRQTGRPDSGDDLMTARGLHGHLFRWAVEQQLVEDPGPRRALSPSVYAAYAFEHEPGRVRAEARIYWRSLVREQESWA